VQGTPNREHGVRGRDPAIPDAGAPPGEEVAEEARQQQIASLADVRWAVLEATGKISFIPK
jgi:hypothetical protein